MGSYHLFAFIARFNRVLSKNEGATSQGKLTGRFLRGMLTDLSLTNRLGVLRCMFMSRVVLMPMQLREIRV